MQSDSGYYLRLLMKTMEILHLTDTYVIAVKDPDMISEQGVHSMPEALAQKLSRNPETIFTVHRLDRTTGGVMVYALDPHTAAVLSQSLGQHMFHKEYLAVVEHAPDSPEGQWHDMLYWDRTKQKSYIVDRKRKGVKDAELSYRVLAEGVEGHALVKVALFTGRTHQIRVQFASRGYPLLGDRRYGGHVNGPIALWACTINFPDPRTGKKVQFSAMPPDAEPWNEPAFSKYIHADSQTGN